MAGPPLTRDDVLALLAQNVARIEALTAGVPAGRLNQAPASGQWSPSLILAHLRSCADVWVDAIVTIASEEHPTLHAVSPRTWIYSTGYRDLDFQSSWPAFAEQRADLLDFLERLPPAAWARAATVRGMGAPRERTVHFYAEWLGSHERLHVGQLQRVIS